MYISSYFYIHTCHMAPPAALAAALAAVLMAPNASAATAIM